MCSLWSYREAVDSILEGVGLHHHAAAPEALERPPVGNSSTRAAPGCAKAREGLSLQQHRVKKVIAWMEQQ